jgi:hypothetical protein
MLVWVDAPHGVEKDVDEVKKSKKWSVVESNEGEKP